jgi:hypothetical protein
MIAALWEFTKMSSRRSRQARKQYRPAPAPVPEPVTPGPEPPAEGWKLVSTSVPHLRDAPWGVRLAMAALEKLALLLVAGGAAAALVVAGIAGLVPSFRTALLRWLLALF